MAAQNLHHEAAYNKQDEQAPLVPIDSSMIGLYWIRLLYLTTAPAKLTAPKRFAKTKLM
jgi:hypothetical protein